MQKFSPSHFSIIPHFVSFPGFLPEACEAIAEKAIFKQVFNNSRAICCVSAPFLDSKECCGHVQQVFFLPTIMRTGTDSKSKWPIITPTKKEWAGLDSNQRRLTPTGLQPVPFSLSGTDPFVLCMSDKSAIRVADKLKSKN